MSRLFLTLCCCAALSALIGCAEKPPEGFPKLWPTKVKVLNGTQPVANVNVILAPEASSMNYVISGKTDASGIATIETARGTFTRPGAPDGSYRVMLLEAVKIEMPEQTMEETAGMTQAEQRARQKEYDEKMAAARTFSGDYADPIKTPCRVQVASQAIDVEFDVSKKP